MAIVQRYFVDHTAGKRGREAMLTTGDGRPVLAMRGSEAVLDDRGSIGWYIQPAIIGDLGAGGGHQLSVRRMHHAAAGRPLHAASVRRLNLRMSDFHIDVRDPGLVPGTLTFSQAPDDQMGNVVNGFSPPSHGVWDLWHDGEFVARHWATLGPQYALMTSVFDVFVERVPLPELVLIFTARFLSWRPLRREHGAGWSPF